MSDPTPARDNRWWENYAVRYLVPTLTGMMFLRWLQMTTRGFFSPLLPAAGDLAAPHIFQKLGVPELLVWAGGGFAFAYVASLPILVFHATRSLETTRKPAGSSPSAMTTWLAAATIGLATASHFHKGWSGLALIVVLIVALFSFGQWRRLQASTLGRFPAIEYARALARSRSPSNEADRSRWIEEYVTSYRHLREHGNAAFIVLLQAVLCTLVYTCLTSFPGYERWTWDSSSEGQWLAYALCFLLLILWIAPAVGVHPLSQKLEAHLATRYRPNIAEAPAKAPLRSSHTHQSAPPPAPVTQAPAATPAPSNGAAPRSLPRTLKTLSQCSPWLLPLAFCPPILLLWFHLQNLHYPSLLMSAISSTAGLGALLLLGGLVWVLWLLSLAFPSLLVAMSASLYQAGGVPARLVQAWIIVCLGAAGWIFAMTQLPETPPWWSFFLVYAALALPVGLATWSKPPAPILPPRNDLVQRLQAVLSGALTFCIALLALCLLLLPFFLMSRAYGKEPDSLLLILGVIGFSVLGALAPGIAFAWSCRGDGQSGRRPMSASGFAVLLIIPPLLSTLYLTAVQKQLSYLTLAAAGIVDKGGASAQPRLFRLPDNWSAHDHLLTTGFPPLKQCGATGAPAPDASTWLCGYTNFAFGSTQLICDKPYADESGGYIDTPLTCLVFAGNQVINLVNLPKPGSAR